MCPELLQVRKQPASPASSLSHRIWKGQCGANVRSSLRYQCQLRLVQNWTMAAASEGLLQTTRIARRAESGLQASCFTLPDAPQPDPQHDSCRVCAKAVGSLTTDAAITTSRGKASSYYSSKPLLTACMNDVVDKRLLWYCLNQYLI